MDTQYFFTDKITDIPNDLKGPFQWLIEDLKNEKVIFHIPLLTHLDGIVEDFLGDESTRKLRSKKSIIMNNIKIHLSIDKNMLYSHEPVKILTYLAKDEQLDKIESSYRNISKILAVPWLNDDINEWKQTRRAKKIECR